MCSTQSQATLVSSSQNTKLFFLQRDHLFIEYVVGALTLLQTQMPLTDLVAAAVARSGPGENANAKDRRQDQGLHVLYETVLVLLLEFKLS